MKFKIEIDIDTFNRETSRFLGVVFTKKYVREFLTRHKDILGALANQTGSYDTYEREWLMEILTYELVGQEVPHNGATEEESNTFREKWIKFITTSDIIDREVSKTLIEDGE